MIFPPWFPIDKYEYTGWSGVNRIAKFHKVGRYDQLRCKTYYYEIRGNNITSNLGVTLGLNLIAILPPTMKLFLYERHQKKFVSLNVFCNVQTKSISSLYCLPYH